MKKRGQAIVCPRSVLCVVMNLLTRNLFPLIFENLIRPIYALYCILKGDFDTDFLPIISFIEISVAENVAKLLVEWCRVAFTSSQG